MHELPKDLTKSLRSWRGSVVRDSVDLEKADHDDRDDGRQLRSVDSSMVLHPTKSSRALGSHYDDRIHRHQWERQPLTQKSQPNQPHNDDDLQSPTQPKRATTFDKQTYNSTGMKSVFDVPPVKDPDGAASRLDDDPTPLSQTEFYELIGMNPPEQGNTYPKRFAVPNGLYAKIKDEFDSMTVKFRVYNVLTYFFMSLQLVLGAIFIILGSLGNVDSHVAIAVLGAVGTIVAGALALMKGQGLPNRLRQTRDNLGYVVFEAQELYWDVGAGRAVTYKDIKKVREDYLRVMEEARRNHPDTWNSYSDKVADGLIRPGTTQSKGAWVSRLTLPLAKQHA